ncbi:hypothetical protein Vretimale_10815 [Volvox reticuliferus]|uniref:Uncharacterized protein n=1 Tax=Volvox reticuliferus TaxID=1737510 RepID=A0A8J4CNM5_9CHLO|nr:hypothetical protein Vretifemale_13777 [Volvox reticuliferus]GIM06516.1 hypothetical protein Vretimale_10815 [Volvox reticuliferus]
MALAATVSRKALAVYNPAFKRSAAPVCAVPSRRVSCRSQLLSTVAAVGDVDAPISVVVGAAVAISLVATAIVPLALNPGQKAADKMFAATEKAPLDKKPAAGKKAKK